MILPGDAVRPSEAYLPQNMGPLGLLAEYGRVGRFAWGKPCLVRKAACLMAFLVPRKQETKHRAGVGKHKATQQQCVSNGRSQCPFSRLLLSLSLSRKSSTQKKTLIARLALAISVQRDPIFRLALPSRNPPKTRRKTTSSTRADPTTNRARRQSKNRSRNSNSSPLPASFRTTTMILRNPRHLRTFPPRALSCLLVQKELDELCKEARDQGDPDEDVSTREQLCFGFMGAQVSVPHRRQGHWGRKKTVGDFGEERKSSEIWDWVGCRVFCRESREQNKPSEEIRGREIFNE